MKHFLLSKKALVTAALVSGGLFAGGACANPFFVGPYGYTAPGNTIQAIVFPSFTLGNEVTFTFTGEGPGASLADASGTREAEASPQAGIAARTLPLRADGSLPDGTYSFVDEDGGVAKVQVEDGEITVLQ